MTIIDRNAHSRMSGAIRALAMDAVEAAKSGHPGLPLGAADVATVLFSQFLNIDPKQPGWADRDRFVLSAGHGSMLIYALLHLTGFEAMTLDEIRNFRQFGSKTAGHPEYGHTPGIETTTGPLGQGIANAVGMAMAERQMRETFGAEVASHYTYCLAGDGCLMEGISQEAIALAGHLKLNKLILLWDDNGISIDGSISLSCSVDQIARFQSAGWATMKIDGHDPQAIADAIAAARTSDKPTLIACKTTIGFGAPTKAGKSSAHGSPLGAEEIAGVRKAIGWEHGPFEIPQDVYALWSGVAKRGATARGAWEGRLAAHPQQAEFTRRMAGRLPDGALDRAIATFKAELAAKPQEVATRKASEMTLEVVAAALPELVGGSADLTGSNNTRTKGMKALTPADFTGNFVHWGIREHAMAAALNGMVLHGGVLPISGTFLVFSDYSRPAIRLAALMGIRAIHVLTHDSIGVGEDGPTHQPVEHLAALRAIPNLNVFRPADVVETAECWQVALESATTPSALALTRQNLPQLRSGTEAGNLCAGGAYELAPAEGGAAQVSIFASGSEVAIAMDARKLLASQGVRARVVSVPCLDIFLGRPAAERAAIIGDAPVKIAVEAAIRMGWDQIIGADGAFIGMGGFGASAPIKALYQHFGITAEAIAAAAVALRAGN